MPLASAARSTPCRESRLGDWILDVLQSPGYGGLAGLMLLAYLVPVLPTEAIMPVAGYLSSSETFHLGVVVLAGASGSLVGTLPWYFGCRRLDEDGVLRWFERHGAWIAITPDNVRKAQCWFEERGRSTVCLARLVPGLRELISVPAGLTSMAILPCLLFSALGVTLWTGMLAGAGYLLGRQFPAVHGYVGMATRGLEPGAAALYIGAQAAAGRRTRRADRAARRRNPPPEQVVTSCNPTTASTSSRI
jgi:membrane protein DedA with SNARE-associated domain